MRNWPQGQGKRGDWWVEVEGSEYAWSEIGRFLRKQHLPLSYSIPLFSLFVSYFSKFKEPEINHNLLLYIIHTSALLFLLSILLSLRFSLSLSLSLSSHNSQNTGCELLFSSSLWLFVSWGLFMFLRLLEFLIKGKFWGQIVNVVNNIFFF